MTDQITAGTPAPDFTLPRDGGGEITLSDLKGQQVVLYFYPKDDTPGCTKEGIAFSEAIDDFTAAGAVVIGISKDTAAKHDKFVAKHDLKVILVSDADGTTCEDYGTWVEKSMYGKTYMGIERATFLIGTDGLVRQVWRKVKVPGHSDAVLEAVRA
ncbi:thioredoxin-dependent thiol peroxidase [Jannaschia donghaensis]|uniref:thioredoxin-dependent peroxiredoxin n=1 Tax=Jannaschia donghaensis TaxID=420998 RepID=A0A0M6YP94_9RHOB|nr:thioredoxin-dependent thiol peroxidase [Jannaschia donghaensis]CTQ51067.1 Putative peroxiredoxin bcp [Jannaschia donghaensis]